ncbi:MAG: spore coat associated protein CotJA [Lachnospiraceae bacterium]|nr:spore coat associated protein CotJA [Lachnospiraceae bacterium]
MEINQKPIAMAYVPWQTWQNIYEPPKALMVGTIFADLDKPFTGRPVAIQPRKGGQRNGRY